MNTMHNDTYVKLSKGATLIGLCNAIAILLIIFTLFGHRYSIHSIKAQMLEQMSSGENHQSSSIIDKPRIVTIEEILPITVHLRVSCCCSVGCVADSPMVSRATSEESGSP